jgi:hypothetical protein
MSAELAGETLAQDVWDVLQELSFAASGEGDIRLSAAARVVELPYRRVTEAEVAGSVRGAQRFVDPTIYDRTIPPLVRKIEERQTHIAEIQVLCVGDRAIVGVPGEFFCELGLRIKERAWPVQALISSCTNGRVGYIPTREAFQRGGYETTFGPNSMLAPEAGALIVQAALELIEQSASVD